MLNDHCSWFYFQIIENMENATAKVEDVAEKVTDDDPLGRFIFS